MHGTWVVRIAYGLFWWLVANHTITPPTGSTFVPLGYWFIVLAAITLSGTLASLTESLSLFSVLGTLTAGLGAPRAQLPDRFEHPAHVGWLGPGRLCCPGLVHRLGHDDGSDAPAVTGILPLFKMVEGGQQAGCKLIVPVQYADGEPGVKMGQ